MDLFSFQVNVTLCRSLDFESIGVRTDDTGKKSKLVFTHLRKTETLVVSENIQTYTTHTIKMVDHVTNMSERI